MAKNVNHNLKKQVNSKEDIPPIYTQVKQELIPFSIDLFKNIHEVLKYDLKLTTDLAVCTEIGFNNRNLSSILKGIKDENYNIKRSIKEFISLGYNHLIKYHRLTHPFNESTKCFQRIKSNTNPLFNDGQYYGTFQRHDNFYHFIMLIDGKNVTVTSDFGGIIYGTLKDNHDTYFAQLTNEENTSTNFFIGLKFPADPKERIFIATWYTKDFSPDHLINSALCIAVHIENPHYKNLEEIELARIKGKQLNKKLIHTEINSKLEHEVFNKLKRKIHNHICQTEKEL